MKSKLYFVLNAQSRTRRWQLSDWPRAELESFETDFPPHQPDLWHSIGERLKEASVLTVARQLPSSPFFVRIFAFPTMAGGAGKYRHLSRDSAHRQALLRNLVTSLFENESITTTWAKAKEAQRLADQLITLGKKNTEASRRRALQIFYVRDSEVTAIITTLDSPQSLMFVDGNPHVAFPQEIIANKTRNHTQSSTNSSVRSANATPTDQAVTPVSYASNQSKNTNTTPCARATRTPNRSANRTTKPPPLSWN